MPRFVTMFAWIAVLAVGGCNQQVAVLESPVSPSPTASPIPVPAQPQVASISISPPGALGGDGATGIVTLAGEAQVFPVTVSLSSNNEAAIVSSEATVPAGSRIGRFGISTRRLATDRTVVISASTSERTVTTNFEVWTIQAPVYFKYFSGERDPVGEGGFGRLVPATATFSAACDRNEVRILVTAPGAQSWSATFRAPGSEPLVRGFYDVYNAVGAGSDGELPGLDIRGQGRGCSLVDGRFLIEDLDLRNNRVNLFHATFRQRCDGHDGGLDGEVRIENMPNSSAVNCSR